MEPKAHTRPIMWRSMIIPLRGPSPILPMPGPKYFDFHEQYVDMNFIPH
jgi:hypothetical protein